MLIFSATNEGKKINTAVVMELARIVKAEWEVDARLAELFGVLKSELVQVAGAAVGARRDAVDDDPITAPGTLSYIYGTRALRTLFRAKKWDLNRKGGVESVFHRERRLKIVFQNADQAADDHRPPQAVSDKGSATELAVRLGQYDLFPKLVGEAIREATAAVWYLFVSCNGDDVRAELSYPKSVVDGQFLGFHERIFIIEKGDLDDFDFSRSDGTPPIEFDVAVTRK